MKHLKKFEELNKSTYLSAADKLEDKGHTNRANSLRDYAKDIIVSDDDFTFYINRGHSTVNPKVIVAKITDIKIDKEPISHKSAPKRTVVDRLKGRNKDEVTTLDHYNLNLEVKFSDGTKFEKNIGVEHLQEIYGGQPRISSIKFTTRKDAVKFINICNEYIKNNTKKGSFYAPVDIKYLSVNDFYKD